MKEVRNMKNKYVKPDVEFVLFSTDDLVMNDDIIDGELGTSGEFDF